MGLLVDDYGDVGEAMLTDAACFHLEMVIHYQSIDCNL